MHGHFLPLPCTSRIPIVFVVVAPAVAVATCPATPAVVFKTFAAVKHFYGPCVLVAHDGHGSLRGLAHTHTHLVILTHTHIQSKVHTRTLKTSEIENSTQRAERRLLKASPVNFKILAQ